RRPDPQRGAGAHGDAPARLLPAAVRRDPAFVIEAELERVTYRFRRPVTTAYGTLTEREVLVLRLRDEDGNEGVGEAAPLEAYDGVSIDEAREAFAPALAQLEAGEIEAARASGTRLAQADAALDVALF